LATRSRVRVRYWRWLYDMTHRRYDRTTFSPDSDPAVASSSSRRPSRLAWPRALWTRRTARWATHLPSTATHPDRVPTAAADGGADVTHRCSSPTPGAWRWG